MVKVPGGWAAADVARPHADPVDPEKRKCARSPPHVAFRDVPWCGELVGARDASLLVRETRACWCEARACWREASVVGVRRCLWLVCDVVYSRLISDFGFAIPPPPKQERRTCPPGVAKPQRHRDQPGTRQRRWVRPRQRQGLLPCFLSILKDGCLVVLLIWLGVVLVDGGEWLGVPSLCDGRLRPSIAGLGGWEGGLPLRSNTVSVTHPLPPPPPPRHPFIHLRRRRSCRWKGRRASPSCVAFCAAASLSGGRPPTWAPVRETPGSPFCCDRFALSSGLLVLC